MVRIYTYTDKQGNVFYSLSRLPSLVNANRTLKIQSWIGAHPFNFLLSLRKLLTAAKVEDQKA